MVPSTSLLLDLCNKSSFALKHLLECVHDFLCSFRICVICIWLPCHLIVITSGTLSLDLQDNVNPQSFFRWGLGGEEISWSSPGSVCNADNGNPGCSWKFSGGMTFVALSVTLLPPLLSLLISDSTLVSLDRPCTNGRGPEDVWWQFMGRHGGFICPYL